MNSYEELPNFKELRNRRFVGFAQQYLERCDKQSKSDHEIDIKAYSELVELDSKLGTSAAEQLFVCLYYRLRSDLIKVSNN